MKLFNIFQPQLRRGFRKEKHKDLVESFAISALYFLRVLCGKTHHKLILNRLNFKQLKYHIIISSWLALQTLTLFQT